jgi:Zn-dependent protease with chaperone function
MWELIALIIGSIVLVGYHIYVGTEMLRADCYSRGQKIAQASILLLLPLLGALLIHWFLRMHEATQDAPDRAFIAQREPNAETLPRIYTDET